MSVRRTSGKATIDKVTNDGSKTSKYYRYYDGELSNGGSVTISNNKSKKAVIRQGRNLAQAIRNEMRGLDYNNDHEDAIRYSNLMRRYVRVRQAVGIRRGYSAMGQNGK